MILGHNWYTKSERMSLGLLWSYNKIKESNWRESHSARWKRLGINELTIVIFWNHQIFLNPWGHTDSKEMNLTGHLFSVMDPGNFLESWINKAKAHLFCTSSINTVTGLLNFTWRKISPCEIVPTTNLNLMIELDTIILQLPIELMELDFKHQWLLTNVFRVNQTS